MVEAVSARRMQTRERLIDAAVQVFAEKGVLGASVEEICELAGFTRGAFYSNFESKDALCLAAVEHDVDRNLVATREAIAALPDAVDVPLDELLEAGLSVFLRAERSDRRSILAGAELQLYAARSDSFRRDYRALVDRVSLAFAELIIQAAAAAGYRPALPPIQLVRVLHGVYEQTSITSLIDSSPTDDPARAKMLSGVLKSMLIPA